MTEHDRRGRCTRTALRTRRVRSAARRALWVLALASFAIAAGPSARQARAQATERPRPPGTHFILEGGVGTSLSRSPREVLDATWGVGAKLRGSPLRAYFISQLGYVHSLREETEAWGRDERRDLALGAGVRLYVSLPDRLRLHLDALGGPDWVRSEVRRAGSHALRHEGWYPQLTLSPGVQYRLLRELSLGVRAKWLIAKTGLEELRETAGVGRRHPWSAVAGVTWHY